MEEFNDTTRPDSSIPSADDGRELEDDVRQFDDRIGGMLRQSASERMPSGLSDRLFAASREHLRRNTDGSEDSLRLVGTAADESNETPMSLFRLAPDEPAYPRTLWKHAAAAAMVLIGLSLIMRIGQLPGPQGPTSNSGTSTWQGADPLDVLPYAFDSGSFFNTDLETDLAILRSDLDTVEQEFTLAGIEDATTFFADASIDWELDAMETDLSQF